MKGGGSLSVGQAVCGRIGRWSIAWCIALRRRMGGAQRGVRGRHSSECGRLRIYALSNFLVSLRVLFLRNVPNYCFGGPGSVRCKMESGGEGGGLCG